MSLILVFVAIFSGPISIISNTAFAANGAVDPRYIYTKSATTAAGSYGVSGEGVATDANGNVYEVGSIAQSATFHGTDSFSARNGYITKYDAQGTYQSTIGIGDTTSGWVSTESVAVDSTGAIYVAGAWAGSVVFGGRDALTDSNAAQMPYVAKFNADGSYAWTRTFYAPNGHGNGMGVAVDTFGNVYFTGIFYGTVAFGMGETATGDANKTSAFLTQYDSNGNYGWTKTLTSSSNSSAWGANVAVNASGDVAVVGNVDGPGAVAVSGTQAITSANGSMYALTYDRAGNYTSLRMVSTTNGFISGNGIKIGPDGSTYVTGAFTGTVTFGGTDTFTDAGNQVNSYVMKYDPQGHYAWTRSYDTTHGIIQSSNLTVDSDGTVYVSGIFTGIISYSGTTDTFTDVGNVIDGYVSSFRSDGTYQWTRAFDTSAGGSVQANGVTITQDRQLYVVGMYGGTVTFGGTDQLNFNNNDPSSASIYLTRYTIPALPAAPVPVVPQPVNTPVSTVSTNPVKTSPYSAPHIFQPVQTNETTTDVVTPSPTVASTPASALAADTQATATQSVKSPNTASTQQNLFATPLPYLGIAVVIAIVSVFIIRRKVS